MNQQHEARAKEVERLVVAALKESAHHLRGHRIVLFGSRARGDARPRSDFDLGAIGKQPLSLQDFNAVQDRLERLPTLYRIDWIDLNRAPASLRDRAVREGRVLYEA